MAWGFSRRREAVAHSGRRGRRKSSLKWQDSRPASGAVSLEGKITDASQAMVKLTGVPRAVDRDLLLLGLLTDRANAEAIHRRVFTMGWRLATAMTGSGPAEVKGVWLLRLPSSGASSFAQP
jgi:hypothetical protein